MNTHTFHSFIPNHSQEPAVPKNKPAWTALQPPSPLPHRRLHNRAHHPNCLRIFLTSSIPSAFRLYSRRDFPSLHNMHKMKSTNLKKIYFQNHFILFPLRFSICRLFSHSVGILIRIRIRSFIRRLLAVCCTTSCLFCWAYIQLFVLAHRLFGTCEKKEEENNKINREWRWEDGTATDVKHCQRSDWKRKVFTHTHTHISSSHSTNKVTIWWHFRYK